MVLFIRDEAANGLGLELLQKVDRNSCEIRYGMETTNVLLARKPSLIVLQHSAMESQIKELRAATKDSRALRILVVLPPDQGDFAFWYRVAGADTCLVLPQTDAQIRHVVRNELAASRRGEKWNDAAERHWIYNKRYEILKVLGIGLRTSTLLARDRSAGRVVTVKVLRNLLLDYPSVVAEYRETARTVGHVNSPFLPRLLEEESFEGCPAMVYDLAEGKNLYAVLRDQPEMDEITIDRMVLSLVRGLGAIKQTGHLHFNLKPDNVILAGGKWYLADFGLVTPQEAPLDNSGFPYWAEAAWSSPEFFRSDAALNARSDIYCLGLLAFVAAERRNPFFGLHYAAVDAIHRQKGSDAVLFSRDNGRSASFVVVVEGMLMSRIEARPKLRDLELIFSQMISLDLLRKKGGGVHPEERDHELSATQMLGKSDTDTLPVTPAGGAAAPSERKAREETQTVLNTARVPVEPEPPVRAARPMDLIWSYIYPPRWSVLAVLAAAVFLFIGGCLCGRSGQKQDHFKQGPLRMFTCYNGHTHSDRTLDFRMCRCRECGELTSLSYRCNGCGKIFGLSLWPRRDMTEDECVEFEKKTRLCPYCHSENIAPTPVRKD